MSGIDAKDETHLCKLILVLSNVGENFRQLIIVTIIMQLKIHGRHFLSKEIQSSIYSTFRE